MNTLPPILAGGRSSRAALAIVFGVLQAIAMGVAAFATRDIFSQLHADTHAAPYVSILTLALAGLFVAGAYALARVQAEAIGQSFARDIRNVLYRQLAGMSENDLSQKRLGALSLRFVGDLSAARGWAGLGVTRLIRGVIILPGAIFVLHLLNPLLALYGGIPVFSSLIIAALFAGGLQHRHSDLRSRRANIAISMIERINMAAKLDLLGRTGKEVERLDSGSAALGRMAISRVRRSSMLRALPQIGASFGGVAILWTAINNDIPASTAAGALAILGIVVLPLRELTGVWDRWCAWRIAKAKLELLFAQPSELRDVCPVGDPVPVSFDNVTFRGVHLNVNIEAGSTVYISGEAGSGKSSIASLIASQNVPEEGLVSYGTIDGSLPRISYIGDTGLILQGSLRRSLSLGVTPRPKTKVMKRAARLFGLKPLMSRLDGLRGRLHEQGKTVSASEAFRLELARTVLIQPDLIVIDNAQIELEQEKERFLRRLRTNTNATLVIVADHPDLVSAGTSLNIIDGKVAIVPFHKEQRIA